MTRVAASVSTPIRASSRWLVGSIAKRPGRYNITVRATSTDTSTTTRVFTITIGDVDEFDVGAVSDADATANAVDENAVGGHRSGSHGQCQRCGRHQQHDHLHPAE